jgi:hypothetical protein
MKYGTVMKKMGDGAATAGRTPFSTQTNSIPQMPHLVPSHFGTTRNPIHYHSSMLLV